jgi:alpha/beta superfamily hydrolase
MTANLPQDAPITLAGPVGVLEAVLTAGAGASSERASYVAILCHPHPVHGGSMNNKVITTLMRAYRDLGISVVRFNFRGVGKSAGSFDNGVGEVEDVLAVVAWAQQQFPQAQLLLAGFSFGSAMAAQASYRLSDVQHLLLIAPPVERYAYDREGRFSCPVAVVIGGADELVKVAGVRYWVAQLQPPARFAEYPEAGHFFHGYLSQLKNDVSDILLAEFPTLGAREG